MKSVIHLSAVARSASLGLLGMSLAFSYSAAAGDYAARIYTNAAGRILPYRLLIPKDYQKTHKYPLVILFHGAGERGSDNQAQLVHGARVFADADTQARFPCFVLVPQCPPEEQWVDMPWGADSGVRPARPSQPMNAALELIRSLRREFNLDTHRFYVTGLSMGGYATWDCITRFPKRFAAAVPICGGGDETTVTRTVARVPVWAFHSSDDGVVKVQRTRNMIQAMRAAGGNPKYSEYSGLGHNAWDKAFAEPELLPWMFAQRAGHRDTYQLKTPPSSTGR